jgi:DNA replication complex GINS protein SLD5 C-terminus
LKEYTSLLDSHLHKTVLDHFPQDVWKRLDEPEMIDEPELTSYVFVRTKEEVTIGINRDDFNENEDDNSVTNRHSHATVHDKGSCLIVLYSTVRNLFLQDKIELLGLA